jgi:hypothetical protein
MVEMHWVVYGVTVCTKFNEVKIIIIFFAFYIDLQKKRDIVCFTDHLQ